MAKDLTGQTFGRLTVLYKEPKETNNKKRIYWVCRCQCGLKVTVRSNHLTSGNTNSCGCLARDNQKKWAEENTIDMLGHTVKSWEVVRRITDKEKKEFLELSNTVNQTYWECHCNLCGAVRFCGGRELRLGTVSCCECKGGKVLWANDIKQIIGQTIGYVTIENLLNPEDLKTYGEYTIGLPKSRWVGRCFCGMGIELTYREILNYSQKKTLLSCGCMKKKKFRVGDYYGSWFVLSEIEREGKSSKWNVRCTCGFETTLTSQTLSIARKEPRKEHDRIDHFKYPENTSKTFYRKFKHLVGTSLVYFIRENSGAVKVGVTSDIVRRITGLQHHSPYPLKILLLIKGNRQKEKELHEKLNNNRLRGEWFLYNRNMEKLLEECKRTEEVLLAEN